MCWHKLRHGIINLIENATEWVFNMSMDPALIAVRNNLFPASHAAISDWSAFPWHRDHKNAIDAYKTNSSQALAIDIFGTIKVSNDRHRLLAAIARRCNVPDDGDWEMQLEWTDEDNLLNEPRPTQVDAVAFGRRSLLVIECKFTEVGGGCSQPNQITNGPHSGQRQCNGDYVLQVNPVNGVEGRCALTGKGICYWESIPKIFGLDANQDYRPCPFKGDAYQWMRNVVLADRLAEARGISAAVIAAYANAENLPTAKKARTGLLGRAVTSGGPSVTPRSYQSIIALARSVSDNPKLWDELAQWVDRKIRVVTG